MAREHEVMSVSDALEVLALWCKENIDGGDSVLMKLIKINDMEPWQPASGADLEGPTDTILFRK